MLNRHMPPVNVSHFSMVPRGDIPRSTFKTQHTYKSTFSAGLLIPFFADEVQPADVFKGKVTLFGRLATALFPIMDNIQLETFFFFVPNRLVWSNWRKMMGERANPSDSISYTVPVVNSAANGFPVCSIYDYMGLPCVGQVTAGQVTTVSALPFRAYGLIWNEWFRHQDLQNSVPVPLGDGPDTVGGLPGLLYRNRRHDYFRSCLPWPLKGGVEPPIPLVGLAPVKGLAVDPALASFAGNPAGYLETPAVGAAYNSAPATGWVGYWKADTANQLAIRAQGGPGPIIYADLSQGASATLSAIRLAAATQQLLEKDARGGTRYTELLRNHFGVMPEDARLQRPEYIGGGKSTIETQAIAQTAPSGLTGATTPFGALSGASVVTGQHEFSYHATEHGWILGLVQASADVTYQQGVPKKFSRRTRYDYPWPVFANLSEQAVLLNELYHSGNTSLDGAVFGYQERYAELRHRPSQITGLFRSTSAGNIDEWHLAEQFSTPPLLNDTFLQDRSDLTIRRALAAGSLADNMQILLDSVFDIQCTRALPTYSVPGLDRF